MLLRPSTVFVVVVASVLGGIGDGLEWQGGVVDTILSLMLDSNEVGPVSDDRQEEVVADEEPPPYDKTARMARYVLHNADWASLATISSRPEIASFPFSNVFSVSDGATSATSSGVPYFYLSVLEMSVHDLQHDNRASMSVSLAQGQYCAANHLDPEDPRCAHVIFTGRMQKLKPGSDEEAFAKKALFKRHPEMPGWPKDHGWFLAKMNMSSIIVLDFFGGAKTVALKDYFKAKPY